MNKLQHIKATLAGVLLSSCVVPVVLADDIEIYTTLGASGKSSNPNIMFLIDTSGSMTTESKVKESYDESETYAGSCASTGIYFVDNGKTPNCATSTDYFNASALVCDHAVVGYDADGDKITPPQDGALLMVGTFSDQLAQFDGTSKKWRLLKVGTTAERGYMVECFSDSGIHGDGSPHKDYIEDGGTGFTSTEPVDLEAPHAVWAGGAGNLQLFAGNYLNYLTDVSVPLVDKSYMEQVKSAVELMVRGNTRIDIGLMQFDKDGEGGAIQYPIIDVGASRNDFFSRLKTLKAEGVTPLSETYYEALLYFGGKEVDYSKSANPGNQVTSKTLKPGNKEFLSPITSSCDKNYIVVLSDGSPYYDYTNSDRREKLPGFNASACNSSVPPTGFWALFWDYNQDAGDSAGSTVDNCLDEYAEWAYTQDIAQDSSVSAHEGDQHLITHMIGFELGDADAVQLMTDAARKGGGDFYQASGESELISIFNKIIASTLLVNTTFTSPAVSVNAFNRSTHLDDLYFTLFKPGQGNHWDGNLKKYKLEFNTDPDTGERTPFIADKNHAPAISATTGFFGDDAWSYWSDTRDDKDVSKGGASGEFTTTRNVFTVTGAYTDTDGVFVPSNKLLTADSNAVDTTNSSLTDAMLEITGLAEIVTGTSYRDTLLNWASGLDSLSQFGTANTYTDVRPQMGDPLHAEPALVQYGGTTIKPDLVAYVATNDGYLHAFNTDTGAEYFSFIPQELLPNLSVAMEDAGGAKLYGIDGSVVAWIYDREKDGFIDAGDGDHVYLYFGMRRGGRNVYALDVTDRKSPELLWVIKGGEGDYAELGDTWSTINVEKVKDGATEKTVLIFGGGYDNTQDSATLTTKDTVGRTVFIADAASGKRLWSAGKDGVATTDMEYSIPARVKPLDISGDGYVDRLYVADVGGQIFRFDINNTNGAALSSSITGQRIAKISGSTKEDSRRFYYPPDVALVDGEDGNYHALSITSGYRAHPLYDVIHDRIYMIKDRQTGLITSATGYKKDLTEDDLHDATDNLAGGDGTDDTERKAEFASITSKEGWYIDLDDEDNSGDWIGEKGLAESLILEGVIILTTYTPNIYTSTDICAPNIGLGKVFFLDIEDATPAYPQDVDKRAQRHIQLVRGGIPPSPNVMITSGGVPTLCVGTECQSAGLGLGVRKTYWYEVEK